MNPIEMPEATLTTVPQIRGPGTTLYGIGIAESEERRHRAPGAVPNSTGKAFPAIGQFSSYHALNPPDT
jgi:hypothetical protein